MRYALKDATKRRLEDYLWTMVFRSAIGFLFGQAILVGNW